MMAVNTSIIRAIHVDMGERRYRFRAELPALKNHRGATARRRSFDSAPSPIPDGRRADVSDQRVCYVGGRR